MNKVIRLLAVVTFLAILPLACTDSKSKPGDDDDNNDPAKKLEDAPPPEVGDQAFGPGNLSWDDFGYRLVSPGDASDLNHNTDDIACLVVPNSESYHLEFSQTSLHIVQHTRNATEGSVQVLDPYGNVVIHHAWLAPGHIPFEVNGINYNAGAIDSHQMMDVPGIYTVTSQARNNSTTVDCPDLQFTVEERAPAGTDLSPDCLIELDSNVVNLEPYNGTSKRIRVAYTLYTRNAAEYDSKIDGFGEYTNYKAAGQTPVMKNGVEYTSGRFGLTHSIMSSTLETGNYTLSASVQNRQDSQECHASFTVQ